MLKLEMLQTFAIVLSDIFFLEDLLCLVDVVLALVNHVDLISWRITVLNKLLSNSLLIRPMPAPQSSTSL